MTQPDSNRPVLDYRGVTCPYNYVKAKLYLEEADMGVVVEIIVDAGEPERNVPQSLERDGQAILERFTGEDGRAHFIVQKNAEY
ncbi:MAG: sulfurtransferase TusA family protein [bacterium]|nr:sulfurtransferase TusA family protein [bacterium]